MQKPIKEIAQTLKVREAESSAELRHNGKTWERYAFIFEMGRKSNSFSNLPNPHKLSQIFAAVDQPQYLTQALCEHKDFLSNMAHSHFPAAS